MSIVQNYRPDSTFNSNILETKDSLSDESVFSSELIFQLSVRHFGFWNVINDLNSNIARNPFLSIGVQNVDKIGIIFSRLMDTFESFKSHVESQTPYISSCSQITHLPSLDASEDEYNLYWNTFRKFSRPTVEGYAFTLLDSYWNGYFAMNPMLEYDQLGKELLICCDILQSILVVEYANPLRGHDGGGWSNTVESGLDAANKNLQLAMLRLNLPSATLYDLSTSDVLFKDVLYSYGTSVSSDVVTTSIALINLALSFLNQLSDFSSVMEDSERSERLKWVLKFHDALQSVVTYLSIVFFELSTFLFSMSMRSLLKQATLILKGPTSIESDSLYSLCVGAMISLTRLPRPWGGAGRSDILSEIWGTWNCLRSHVAIPPTISRWIWSESYHRFPALIINLDSRSDRLGCCHNILDVVVGGRVV